MGSEGCLAGCADETIFLETAMAPEKVFNCVDDFCIGELMFCQRTEFQRMNMGWSAVCWEGDCEQDFGDYRCTHYD